MKQTKPTLLSKNQTKPKIKLRSGYEKKVVELLNILGLPFDYEGESYEYVVTKKYKSDFRIYLPDGTSILLETKGYLDPRSRIALSCMKKQHPEVDIKINFMKANKGYLAFSDKYGYTDTTVGLEELESFIRTRLGKNKKSRSPKRSIQGNSSKSRSRGNKAS